MKYVIVELPTNENWNKDHFYIYLVYDRLKLEFQVISMGAYVLGQNENYKNNIKPLFFLSNQFIKKIL